MKLAHVASWFPLALMAVLAILSYWLIQVIERSAERPAVLANEPDYIVSTFQVRQFSTQGRLVHTLYGQTITHYADKSTATIQKPILLHRPNSLKSVYRMSADNAFVDENLRQITLSNHVKIINQPTRGETSTLYTEKLHYDDLSGIAQSKTPVVVISANNRFSAQQLTLNTRQDTLTLLGDVQATFYH